MKIKSDRWRVTSDKTTAGEVFVTSSSCHVSCDTCHIRRAFTLVEMLAVIVILGILAALLVPSLKNFGHADAMTAATRQMLDDIGRTRQLAISQHTTVYMVFVPAEIPGGGGCRQPRAYQFVRQAIDRLHVYGSWRSG